MGSTERWSHASAVLQFSLLCCALRWQLKCMKTAQAKGEHRPAFLGPDTRSFSGVLAASAVLHSPHVDKELICSWSSIPAASVCFFFFPFADDDNTHSNLHSNFQRCNLKPRGAGIWKDGYLEKTASFSHTSTWKSYCILLHGKEKKKRWDDFPTMAIAWSVGQAARAEQTPVALYSASNAYSW